MNTLLCWRRWSRIISMWNYQCREGYCGSCRTRLVSGQVDWLTEPLAFIQPGEILPCCCRAKGDIEIEM
ncbi:ferredoxin [Klebsiella variicola]|nr:ferredoxin [Klebsiella variicola]